MFAVQVDGQRFKFSASYPPMNRSEFAPVYAFIMKQRSQKETFQIALPDLKNAKGDVSGTVTVSGSHSAGDTTIDITGITGTLKAGDFVKFGGHSKVYMVVADATGDSSNDATITIEPPLRSALTDTESVTYDGVEFTVRLTSDIQEFNTGDLDLYRFEVDFIEAL
jgi:glutamate synthase domain-containing protein 3